MAPTLGIPDGYELLPVRSRENAKAALAAAEEKGFDPSTVLTHPEGYLIPLTEDEKAAAAEADEVEDDEDDEEFEVKHFDLPKATDSNDEIAAWRDEHLKGFEFPEDATNRELKVAALTAEVERHTALQDAEIEAAEAEGRTPVLVEYAPITKEA